MPQPPWGRGPVIDIGGRTFRMPRAPRIPSGPGRACWPRSWGSCSSSRATTRSSRTRSAWSSASARYVRTSDPGPHLKLPFGDRARDQGPGAAPAQDGVRLPDRAGGGAVRVRDPARGAGRVADADRRPERGGRGVDRPVPDQGPEGLPLPHPRRPRDLPRHVRGRHAPGGGRPQRRRSDHHRREARSPSQAKEELQRLCDLYGIGIEIQQLVLQDVNPPEPGEARLQRGEPGHPGEGARDQRGLGRVQPGRAAGEGRGRAGGAGGRGLRARAGEQRARRRASGSRRSTRSTARPPR